MTKALNNLICPLDGQPMRCEGRTWRCASGHSYDLAKQGYVNLLPVQKKRSRDPGDSKAMVQARQRFLQQGYYQPLANAIGDWALADSGQAILDAGCGEGYYLRQLIVAAEQQQKSLSVAALDISKWAVQTAAKQDKRLTWMVASNNDVPLADQSVDSLLCIFGFPVAAEFWRLLSSGGSLLMVDPAADHLRELKQVIYPEVRDKLRQSPIDDRYFELEQQQRHTFTVTLDGKADIHDLLTMTPHLYRSNSEGRQRAAELSQLTVTVDVWLRRYSRKP